MRVTRILKQAEQVLVRAAEGYPTGITGLYQHPNPRPALVTLYKHTLSLLQDKFPKDSIYRQSVESLTKSRLQVVESEEIREKIENQIGGGLIEEILIQAHEELSLANEMAGLKVWEELEESPLPDQWVYFGKKV